MAPPPKRKCYESNTNLLIVCLTCGNYSREKNDGHTCDAKLKVEQMKKAIGILTDSIPSTSTVPLPPPPPPLPQFTSSKTFVNLPSKAKPLEKSKTNPIERKAAPVQNNLMKDLQNFFKYV